MMDVETAFKSAVDYIQNLTLFGWKPGLERFTVLCSMLGNPQDKLKFVHVGGTNGKGSVTVMISKILESAGYKVGSYYSPYVYDIRERIQLNGSLIDKESFVRLTERIKEVSAEIGRTELQHPTEFEVKTALALLYFLEQKADIAVMEVGLGGRLDATNVINPLVSVITNITMDHMDRLGNTIREIAFEKAGIIKPNVHLVTATSDKEALDVFAKTADERNAEIHQVREINRGSRYRIIRYPSDQCVDQGAEKINYAEEPKSTFTVEGIYDVYEELYIDLKGDFQRINAAVSIGAIEILQKQGYEIPKSAVRDGIGSAYIPGRFEQISLNPRIIIDGAHNQDGALHLINSIKLNFKYKRLIFVVSMLSGHSIKNVVEVIAPEADVFIATASRSERSASAEEIAETAAEYCSKVLVVKSAGDAVEKAVSISEKDDLICVTGSFYHLSEIPKKYYRNNTDN